MVNNENLYRVEKKDCTYYAYELETSLSIKSDIYAGEYLHRLKEEVPELQESYWTDNYTFMLFENRIVIIWTDSLPIDETKDIDEFMDYYEENKRLIEDSDIQSLKLFANWCEGGQPVCVDCRMPLIEYYRDGEPDAYRCEICQWEEYSVDEWNELYEDDGDEFYWTSLL